MKGRKTEAKSRAERQREKTDRQKSHPRARGAGRVPCGELVFLGLVFRARSVTPGGSQLRSPKAAWTLDLAPGEHRG